MPDYMASSVKSASQRIGMFLLLLPLVLLFLKPSVQSTLSAIGLPCPLTDDGGAILALVLAIILILLYIATCVRRRQFDLFFVVFTLCVVWIASVTALRKGDVYSYLLEWGPYLSVAALVGLTWPSWRRELLQAVFIGCLLYLVINLVALLAFGDFERGSIVYYPFGIRTVTFRIAFPAICCGMLLDFAQRSKVWWRSLLVFALSFIEVWVGYAAATLVALLLMVVLTAVSRNPAARKKINSVSLLIGNIVGLVLIVFARIGDRFGWIIEGVLGKNITYSGRTGVWDAVYALLSGRHLLYGYGYSYLWSAIYANETYYKHAHNDLLHLLMLGGIVLVVLVGALVFLVARGLYKCRDRAFSSILSCCLFGFLVVGIFEVIDCFGLALISSVAYCATKEVIISES